MRLARTEPLERLTGVADERAQDPTHLRSDEREDYHPEAKDNADIAAKGESFQTIQSPTGVRQARCGRGSGRSSTLGSRRGLS